MSIIAREVFDRRTNNGGCANDSCNLGSGGRIEKHYLEIEIVDYRNEIQTMSLHNSSDGKAKQ